MIQKDLRMHAAGEKLFWCDVGGADAEHRAHEQHKAEGSQPEEGVARDWFHPKFRS